MKKAWLWFTYFETCLHEICVIFVIINNYIYYSLKFQTDNCFHCGIIKIINMNFFITGDQGGKRCWCFKPTLLSYRLRVHWVRSQKPHLRVLCLHGVLNVDPHLWSSNRKRSAIKFLRKVFKTKITFLSFRGVLCLIRRFVLSNFSIFSKS